MGGSREDRVPSRSLSHCGGRRTPSSRGWAAKGGADMLSVRSAAVVLVLLTTAVSCAPAPRATPSAQEQPPPSSVQRTLVVIGGRAPESIAARPLRQIAGAGNPAATWRAFNAGLALNNERNLP